MTNGVVGLFELKILAVIILLGDDAYGASIILKIEEITGEEVSIGSVYTALGRLRRRGLLDSWEGDPTPERGGRRKRFYKVNATGMSAMEEIDAWQKKCAWLPSPTPA